MVLNGSKFPICTLLFLFYCGTVWGPAVAQSGWKSLPMTASLNHSSSHLFNRWGDPMSSNSRYGSPDVEMELAAILRDIAYGNKDESSPSPSSSTTTLSPSPTTTISKSSDVFASQFGKTTREHKSYKTTSSIDEAVNKIRTSTVPITTSTEISTAHISNHPPRNSGEHSVLEKETQEGQERDSGKSVTSEPTEIFPSNIPDEYFPESIESDSTNVNYSWVSSLGVIWEIHVYVAAGFFSLIVFLSLYCLTRVYFSNQLLPRGYYMTINLLVFLASFFRCVYFFHDPYQVSNLLPRSLSNILFQTGPPLVVTALGVLILAILKVARLVIIPFKLQSPLLVTLVGGSLIAASLAIDILSELHGKRMMTLGFQGVIQALGSGWEAALCIGFIVIFIRIEKTAERQQQEIARFTFARMNSDTIAMPGTLLKSTLRISGRLTLVSCIVGLVLAILQIYGLIHSRMVVYTPPLEPWAWFAYQTFCRVLEVIMWATICIASSLPAHLNDKGKKCSIANDSQLLTAFSCKSCLRISNLCKCCLYNDKPSEDMYSTICQSSHVARNFPIHSNGKLIPHNIITSTAVSSNHIDTSLIPIQKSHTLGKPLSHQAIGSDTHFLWGNSHNNSKTLNSSIRPSSLIFTEEGLIKLCSDPHYNESIDIKKLTDELNEKTEYIMQPLRGIYDNCNQSVEDNYINSEALTPEKIMSTEEDMQSQKLTNFIEHNSPSSNFCENFQNNIYNGSNKISKQGYSQLHDSFKNDNSLSPNTVRNNLDVYFCEDDLYHSSAVSSTESSGHIYASIHQPSDFSGDSSKLLIRSDTSNDKVYNNYSTDANFLPSTPKRKSPKKKQHLEGKKNSKSNLSSNEQTLPLTSDKQPNADETKSYFMPNEEYSYTYNPKTLNDEYHYYVSQLNGTPQKYVFYKNYIDPTCANYVSPQVNDSTPKSPSQKIKITSKSKAPKFADVRYSPLSRNEDATEENDTTGKKVDRKQSLRDKGPSLPSDNFRSILNSPRRSP